MQKAILRWARLIASSASMSPLRYPGPCKSVERNTACAHKRAPNHNDLDTKSNVNCNASIGTSRAHGIDVDHREGNLHHRDEHRTHALFAHLSVLTHMMCMIVRGGVRHHAELGYPNGLELSLSHNGFG